MIKTQLQKHAHCNGVTEWVFRLLPTRIATNRLGINCHIRRSMLFGDFEYKTHANIEYKHRVLNEGGGARAWGKKQKTMGLGMVHNPPCSHCVQYPAFAPTPWWWQNPKALHANCTKCKTMVLPFFPAACHFLSLATVQLS